ncbi:hypothetical protein DYB32_001143 [Aphanomyces invadans]|uniref:Uncharacterized protein n=1 Tax=Aphanomyces invadans TaxID=157072 RepID=A0A3R6YFB8_9STRA|nr:hypothetical protein DYB32_001143 [Aphanomyces invadans]
MLQESPENVDDELAQCYACLHGYSLLTTCMNHHGDDVRAKTTTPDTIMELFSFCQNTDKKLVRKESAALFASVLDLPDTKATLQELVPVNALQSSLKAYMNPAASADIHVVQPIPVDNMVPSDDLQPLSELWFDLATNFSLSKVKRRGRDYPQLLQYEVDCVKYVNYLRNDIYLHPNRAMSYRMIASCANALRSMIVDHWIVAWRNFTYPKVQSCADLTSGTATSFELVVSTPFFSQFMEWITLVQQAEDDESSQREVMYKSREMSLVYTNYVAVLAELALRCYDMAAALDAMLATECYEDAGILVWKMLSESTEAHAERLNALASNYFTLGLQQPNVTGEFGLRLNYMLGKLAKKSIKKRTGRLNDWRAALEYFQTAEMHRQKSDLESLPHAFYQLHACRLKILLEPVSKTGALQSRDDLQPALEALVLTNQYFYTKKVSLRSKSDDTATPGNEWTQEKVTSLLADASTLWRAREVLVWNCLEALERVPLDDRYFHPAYYTYAWGLRFAQPIVDRTNEYWTERCTLQSAVKAMKPLFDRKRQQVVAIWLSESETNNLEELHQQQAKYDRLRLKYLSLYLETMTMAGDSQRVSDLTSWILASKEEHWVIDAMLMKALSASSFLARGKILDLYLKCLFPSQDDVNYQPKVLAHLNRVYTTYLEYNEAWHRVRTPSLIQYSQSRAASHDVVMMDLYQELHMEEQPYWATLVDEALTFCSIKWPDKTKTKAKPHVPKTKLLFLASTLNSRGKVVMLENDNIHTTVLGTTPQFNSYARIRSLESDIMDKAGPAQPGMHMMVLSHEAVANNTMVAAARVGYARVASAGLQEGIMTPAQRRERLKLETASQQANALKKKGEMKERRLMQLM